MRSGTTLPRGRRLRWLERPDALVSTLWPFAVDGFLICSKDQRRTPRSCSLLDFGELLTDCVSGEVRQETGLQIRIPALISSAAAASDSACTQKCLPSGLLPHGSRTPFTILPACISSNASCHSVKGEMRFRIRSRLRRPDASSPMTLSQIGQLCE